MALKSTIQAQVRVALDLIQDVGDAVTITKTTEETFDFSDSTVEGTTAQNAISSRALIVNTRRDLSDGAPNLKSTVIFDTMAVGSLDGYDTITLRGATWDIVSYEDNGYIIEAELRRAV